MIRYDVEQGSVDWLALRIGRPTASEFASLITLKKMEPSSAAAGYRGKLLAEWMLGEPLDWDASQFMDRGKRLEDEALKWYSFEHDVEVERVGFCTADLGRYGCSPDAFVADAEIGIEVKCLGPAAHMNYLTASPKELERPEFYQQICGGMLTTGFREWRLILYHPRLPSLVLSYAWDDIFIAKLRAILDRFCADLQEAKETLMTRGYAPPDDGVSSWLKRALEASLVAQ